MMLRITLGGGQPLPFALIAQALPRLSRNDLEALVETLIDKLDAMESCADLEPEEDTGAEDYGEPDGADIYLG